MNEHPEAHQVRMPSISDLLNRTFEVYGSLWKTIFGISLVLVIPAALMLGLEIYDATQPEIPVAYDAQFFIILAVLFVVYLVICIWQSNALAVAMRDRAASPGIETSLQVGAQYILPVLVISIVQIFLYTVSLLAFIIPFFIVMVWYLFVQYVAIYEGKRGWDAFKASREYVRGFWVPVMIRAFAFGIIVWFLTRLPIWTVRQAYPLLENFTGSLCMALIQVPLAIIFQYHMYEWLRHQKHVTKS